MFRKLMQIENIFLNNSYFLLKNYLKITNIRKNMNTVIAIYKFYSKKSPERNFVKFQNGIYYIKNNNF